jgi:ABC-type sugar transport system, permease component
MENLPGISKPELTNWNKKSSVGIANVWIHFVFTAIGLMCILPVLLIVMVSLSKESDVTKYGYMFIPKRLTLEAYTTVLVNPSQILNAYMITIVTTICGAFIGTILVGSMAYVLTRKDYKYRNILTFYVFFTMLFNGGLVPSYILNTRWLHMKDTIFVLFVPMLFNAFYVLLMKGFMQFIPDSLYESAKLDGASELLIFFRIVVPLSKPAIGTVSLFYVLQYWNDWFLCSFYTDSARLLNLQTMLIRVLRSIEFLNSIEGRMLTRTTKLELPMLTARMAICVMAAGPMLFIFPFFQKYFVKGLTLGSVKG